jgi:hypothetical protein
MQLSNGFELINKSPKIKHVVTLFGGSDTVPSAGSAELPSSDVITWIQSTAYVGILGLEYGKP